MHSRLPRTGFPLVAGWAALLLAGCGGTKEVPDAVVEAIRTSVAQSEVSLATTETPPSRYVAYKPASLPFDAWTMEETATESLGRIGSGAVPYVVPQLRHPDPAVRLRATRVLARIGPEAEAAVPALTARLEDPDPQVRKLAAYALGQIGAAAVDAVPHLLRLLQAADDNVPVPRGNP